MPTFTLRNFQGQRVHGAYARGPLEISGVFHLTGPQPVDDKGGCPVWVAELLEAHPNVNTIAISGDDFGIVYSRMRSNNGVQPTADAAKTTDQNQSGG